jgi:hypothetical protein
MTKRAGAEVQSKGVVYSNKETHMAELPPYPGAPRWAKVFGIIALVVVLLFVILLFTRGPGGHGPGRHMPSESGHR